MTLQLLPDAERMLSAYLRSSSELALLVEDRVYTAVPANPVFPLVRLTRTGGPPPTELYWIDGPMIQVDAWGGTKAQTRQAAETCRGLIYALRGTVQGDTVISAVKGGGLQYLPDDSYEPAKPRYLFVVSLVTHPQPAAPVG